VPRSPLVSQAVKDLATYFQAVTDGAFIEQSWSLSEQFEDVRAGLAQAQQDRTRNAIDATQLADILKKSAKITRSVSYDTGNTLSDLVAELVYGSVCIGKFVQAASKSPDELKKYIINDDLSNEGQLKFYAVPTRTTDKFEVKEPTGIISNPQALSQEKEFKVEPTIKDQNFYAISVFNPFMSPMVKDTGAIEIFMNAIPTLEFSKCVPYINLELVSTRRAVGTVAPALTLHGFLNPPSLGSADSSILASQAENVKSEVLDLGLGTRSGIELFTSPQTLVNMGEVGFEFVPVIDRLRPIASLGNLQLTTKMQGSISDFTTGRLELVIHDRSRLREMAAFVRPDLYGTTFLDITYGWSHPEGGIDSKNPIGKFLDSLKHQARYRVSNSTYSFEEGGQIKVTLSIQTVGSMDLLNTGPRGNSNVLPALEKLVEAINDRLAELRGRGTTPSMAQYDVLDTLKDAAGALKAAGNKERMGEIKDLLQSKGADAEISSKLLELYGRTVLTNASNVSGEAEKFAKEVTQTYESIFSSLPKFESDELAAPFVADPNRCAALASNLIVGETKDANGNLTKTQTGEAKKGTAVYDSGAFSKLTEYYSFGSVFMKMVAEPILNTKQYEEVQVIFYPFNKLAGAVHDLPISCFPIEAGRLKAAVLKEVKETPELSSRSFIRLLNDRFVSFAPARAYLMAGFYNQKAGNEGKAESLEFKPVTLTGRDGKPYKGTFRPNSALTLEERLSEVGIPERKIKFGRVQVHVEGCQLLDEAGEPLINQETGRPKTLIKLHVYDSAMEPSSTLSEIITAAKDNELSMIQIPVSEYVRSGNNDQKENAALAAVKAGLDAGILETVDKASLQRISSAEQTVESVIRNVENGTVLLRVAGSYDEIKRVVAAGMPTIIYGSSTSAVVNASLTTGGNAAMANMLLGRAFNSDGERADENVDSGVPMQVLPAKLGMTTIGCPLFHPMQRFFVDFGTGTSIDSCYFVVSVDSTIGKDGFKTELQMAYSAGFPTYSSINQQLAKAVVDFSDTTKTSPAVGILEPAAPTPSTEDVTTAVTSQVNNACDDLHEFIHDLEVQAKKELTRLAAEVEAEINEKAEQAADALLAAIPEQTRIDVAAAAAAAEEAAAKAAQVAAAAQKLAALIAVLQNLPALLPLLGEEAAALLQAKIEECLADAAG
jgi:hypothetical protein